MIVENQGSVCLAFGRSVILGLFGFHLPIVLVGLVI